MSARLVPELLCSDLRTSLSFFVGLIGFTVLYDRPEERFAYLDLEGAELMLEEAPEVGNRQFVVQDPDGYLLRFFSDLGERPSG